MGRVTRRWVVSALLAGAALPACANAPTRSPLAPARPERTAAGAVVPAAEALVRAANLSGDVGFAVIDPASGRVLESRLPDQGQPPASVIKAVTALYGLETLGAGHRFATRLVATGPVSGGRVAGDLVLVGGGDPTLGTDELAALVQGLRARGVTGVSGRFLVHGGALPRIPRIDPDQPDHVGYNPAVSGLNLNYNRVHFRWRRAGSGHEVVMDAPGDRHNTSVSIATMQVQARRAPVYTYADGGPGAERWTVAGSALGQSGSRWLPTRQPELYAGDVLRALARAQGITLPAPQLSSAPPQGAALAEHASQAMGPMLRDMLRWSTNLTAEAVGLAASRARGSQPATLAQSGAQMASWAAGRFGTGGKRLVDHSGLGDGARISPAQMARLLAAPGVEERLGPLLRDFQMRDAGGRPMPNHPLQVAAKTGTLNFVSGLAGYVATPGGGQLAFAIFAADLGARRGIPTEARERPPGSREWASRARRLQQQLIERWGALHA